MLPNFRKDRRKNIKSATLKSQGQVPGYFRHTAIYPISHKLFDPLKLQVV